MGRRPARVKISDSAKALLSAMISAYAIGAAAHEPASPVRPYYDFVYYASVGDIDGAMVQFADDAVVVAGPLCPLERPCEGKAAIKERYVEPMIRGRLALPLAERYDGSRMQARGDSANDRRQARQFFKFRAGRIESVLADGVVEPVQANAVPKQAQSD
jgi:hypothetical protein